MGTLPPLTHLLTFPITQSREALQLLAHYTITHDFTGENSRYLTHSSSPPPMSPAQIQVSPEQIPSTTSFRQTSCQPNSLPVACPHLRPVGVDGAVSMLAARPPRAMHDARCREKRVEKKKIATVRLPLTFLRCLVPLTHTPTSSHCAGVWPGGNVYACSPAYTFIAHKAIFQHNRLSILNAR